MEGIRWRRPVPGVCKYDGDGVSGLGVFRCPDAVCAGWVLSALAEACSGSGTLGRAVRVFD